MVVVMEVRSSDSIRGLSQYKNILEMEKGGGAPRTVRDPRTKIILTTHFIPSKGPLFWAPKCQTALPARSPSPPPSHILDQRSEAQKHECTLFRERLLPSIDLIPLNHLITTTTLQQMGLFVLKKKKNVSVSRQHLIRDGGDRSSSTRRRRLIGEHQHFGRPHQCGGCHSFQQDPTEESRRAFGVWKSTSTMMMLRIVPAAVVRRVTFPRPIFSTATTGTHSPRCGATSNQEELKLAETQEEEEAAETAANEL